MNEITLPSKQVLLKSEVMRKIGKKAVATDLALDMNKSNNRLMTYWLSNKLSNSIYNIVLPEQSNGIISSMQKNIGCGLRPVIYLSPEAFENITKCSIDVDGIKLVNYGEYVQKRVNEKLQKILNEIFFNLEKTGKFYTIMGTKYAEYIYNGKKYCKVFGFWYEIIPLVFIVVDEYLALISKNVLLGNVFIDSRNDFNDSFSQSMLYYYLNTTLKKDIIPSQNNIYYDSIKKELFSQSEMELFTEYISIKEKNERKEETVNRILKLYKLIEEEKRKSEKLDKKINEFQNLMSKSYVKRIVRK